MAATKVAILTNIISPYRISFFNCLNRHSDIELKVFYAAEQESNRSWKTYYDEIKYPFEILKGIHLSDYGKTVYLSIGLFSRLNKFRPDVVIVGTGILNTPVSWLALLYARLRKIPTIRYEANHEYTVSSSILRRAIYKCYYALVDSFFVYSSLTQRYLMTFGINSDRIKVGYNVGETDFFAVRTRSYAQSETFVEVRNKYPSVMLLYIGRLAREKNILGLLDCLFSFDPHDVGLFILGDGPLEKAVAKKIGEFRNLQVFFEGFRQKDECVKYFALSDILVLPSLVDPASIVLSEGLSSGLFTVGSKYDGSAENFIRHGKNGFIIDPLNEMEFKQYLKKAIQMVKDGLIDGEKIRMSMSQYTVEKYAERLVEMIKAVKCVEVLSH